MLLDLVTPGARWGLGFMTDMKRQCVDLSRARIKMIILGNCLIGDLQDRSVGWETIINRHVATNAVVNYKDAHLMSELMAQHRNRGMRYEEVTQRSIDVRRWTGGQSSAFRVLRIQFYNFIA